MVHGIKPKMFRRQPAPARRVVGVEVCQRLMDHGMRWDSDKGYYVESPRYHAQLAGHSGFWGCGDTRNEALGSLINNNPKFFGLAIVQLGKEAR